MTQKTINFARVLLELGMDDKKLQEVRQIFADNPLLADALICPVVSKKEKLQVVDRLFFSYSLFLRLSATRQSCRGA